MIFSVRAINCVIELMFGVVHMYITLKISCALTKPHAGRKCSQLAVDLCMRVLRTCQRAVRAICIMCMYVGV